ncbi:hypothetical protein NQ318_000598 [Aromia moschata]|uniref:H/ACA ribonucleoprotein complex subunit n=1 Tax=Aromia moschata TaxID=1265417 RepID=A0AAV8XRX7_9CUCU|nr:hypothetical protein NQ318_000598 [Aromia moschata]
MILKIVHVQRPARVELNIKTFEKCLSINSHIIFGQKDKGAIKKTSSPFKPSLDENIKGLPPVPDLSNLNINYEKEEFLHMGTIQAIIETLVTVEALPATPAYDLDSYLFVEDKTTKKPLGVIYDVIGPVTAPIYCIRFNTTKDIQDLNLKQGLKVFSAPKSQYTHYVFVKELMR